MGIDQMFDSVFARRQNAMAPEDTDSKPESGFRFGPLLIDEAEIVNHMMIFGATGSGKTTLIRLLLQDIIPRFVTENDWRMMITNPKRDALSVLHGIQPSGVRIVTTDPFDARGVAWDMCRDITEVRTALQFAFTLLPKRHESQPFFTDAARHIVFGVLLSFLHRQLRWTFADLLRAMQSATTIKNVLHASRYTRHIIYLYFYDKRLASNIVSTIAANLLPFGPVAACWETADDSISLGDWVRSNYIIVLGNSDESRDAVEVINRCIFRCMTDLLLALPESDTRRSFVILDEVSESGKLDGLSSLLKRGRSKGTAALIAAQSIAGLRAPELYGPHGTAEIVGQVMHKAFGRLECPETAKWASEVFGEQEILQTTQSRSHTAGSQSSSNTVSTNEQIVTRSAALASEFMDQPPCNTTDGLSGYYLSSLYGAFAATIPGDELFGEDLLPRSTRVEDFVPRSVAAQYLEPWSRQQREKFAPPRKKKSAEKSTSPPPNKSLLDELGDI